MPYNNTPIAPSKEVSGQVSLPRKSRPIAHPSKLRSHLPVARVQKIINADPERLHTSKNAAFAIALATELFIQHLATTTHNVVKAETQKKPRRNVQYRDVAAAVAKTDNLEFLVDVVPKTVLYKEVKEQAAKKKKEAEEKNAKGEGEGKDKGKKPEAPMTREEATTGMDAFLRKYAPKEVVEDNSDEDSVTPDKILEIGRKEREDEAMDVDEDLHHAKETEKTPAVEVDDSEPEEDGAAMQIEMEMRGPRTPRTNGKAPAASPKAPAATPPAPASAPTGRSTRASGGFTAVNGRQ